MAQSPLNSRRPSDITDSNEREWSLRARMINREYTRSRRFSSSYIASLREDSRSFRSNITISSTASSPGYNLKEMKAGNMFTRDVGVQSTSPDFTSNSGTSPASSSQLEKSFPKLNVSGEADSPCSSPKLNLEKEETVRVWQRSEKGIYKCKKRGTLSAGSWTIQEEIHKVHSKATEEMLRNLPSTRIDLSTFTSEHKNIQSSGVPDDGSDEMHLSKSLPETDPVDASVNLVAGCSTIHDPKGNFYPSR